MNIAQALLRPAASAAQPHGQAPAEDDVASFDALLREQRGVEAADATSGRPQPEDTAPVAGVEDHEAAALDAQAGLALALAAPAALLPDTGPASSALADQVRALTEASRALSRRGDGQREPRVTGRDVAAGRETGLAASPQPDAPDAGEMPATAAAARAVEGVSAPALPPAAAPAGQASALVARRAADAPAAVEPRAAASTRRLPDEPARRVEPLAAQVVQPASAGAPASLSTQAGGERFAVARGASPAGAAIVMRGAAPAGDTAARPDPIFANDTARAPALAVQDTPRVVAPETHAAQLTAGVAMPASAGAATPARADAMPTPAPLPMTVPAPVGSPAFAPALGQQLVVLSAGAGDTVRHAEMRLDPPELGPLRVSLTLQGEQASAVFFAAHPATRAALEAALPQLQQQLADAGIQLGQSSVGDQRDFEQHAQDARRGGTSAAGGSDEGDAAEVAGATAARAQPARGLVDTFA